MPRELIKNYKDLICDETEKVRSEVLVIKDCLKDISDQLKCSSLDDERITENLKEIRSDQDLFHKRVQKADRRLNYYKSILASFQS